MAFPITCPSCGKGFQLATEIYERKVAGKVVSIRCKQCQTGIRVDATTPGELKVVGAGMAAAGADSVAAKPPGPAEAAPPPRPRQSTLLGMVGPGGQAPARAPAPADAPLWAVDSGGTGDDRELTDAQMKREIESGALGATTLVWREGQDDWQEIANVPQLARYLPAAKPAPPPPARPRLGSVPDAPRPRLGSAPDAPRPRLGSSPDVPRPRLGSAPQLGVPRVKTEDDEEATMIYDRSAPNAAKFDLPDLPQDLEAPPPPPPLPPTAWPNQQLLAPRPPSAPKAAPPPLAAPAPAPQAPVPPVPRAPTPSAPFAAAPAPAPKFPTPVPAAGRPPSGAPALRPSQAPIPWGPGAPPPAPSPMGVMPPSPFAVSASTTDIDFPKPKSKLPLVIGAIVLVVAIAGVVIATSSGPRPGPVATPAAPPPAPTTTPATTPTPEATATSTATEAAPPSSLLGSNRGGNPLAPPTAQPPRAGSGFSDLFAEGMEKAEKSGVAPAPSQPFDQEEARRAVAALLKTVAECREPGSPVGQTTAAVTFESSGKVSSVTIGAPFAGTSTGTCMVTAFKQAKIAPFAGLPGTVSQAVSLR